MGEGNLSNILGKPHIVNLTVKTKLVLTLPALADLDTCLDGFHS